VEDLFYIPFVRSLAAALVAGALLGTGDRTYGAIAGAIAVALFAWDVRRFRSRRTQ
jgi:membrane protein implicated in regulation of membrane protease activity